MIEYTKSPMGSKSNDSGVTAQGTQRLTQGSLVSACEAGMKRTYFREGMPNMATKEQEAVGIRNGAGKTG